MRNDRRPSSTTSRLKRLQLSRISTALFLSWLFAAAIVICGFLYVSDSGYIESADPFVLIHEVSHEVDFLTSGRLIFPRVTLTMSADGQAPKTIDATAFFYLLIAGAVLLALSNSLIMLLMRIGTKSQIKKQLEPLYKMARTAIRLSDESMPDSAAKKDRGGFEEQKIHNLESAIDSIKADSPNAGLHTGDTDLKGLEEAINSLLERTRASYSQQVRFVSDASHELRTPIAVIKGYADMLDRWGKTDETILDESIGAIKTESEHMNKLVEQLLFLARGDSGRQKLDMQPLSVTDLIRDVYEESVMIDQDHKWEIRADGNVTATGDAAMLKQAIRILVDNAAKYTPQGETITLKALSGTDGCPVIVVQDSGIGISGEDMSHIFERFYRSDPARNRQKGGTGLGLSIAKWIIDRHGGYFDVLSGEDIGTRISIHLPAPSQ